MDCSIAENKYFPCHRVNISNSTHYIQAKKIQKRNIPSRVAFQKRFLHKNILFGYTIKTFEDYKLFFTASGARAAWSSIILPEPFSF
jgi:hypothetical protein